MSVLALVKKRRKVFGSNVCLIDKSVKVFTVV